MKKLAEISRLTLEAFTSEEAAKVKKSTIEDINKVGDLGLELANSNPVLKEKIITRELRENPKYIKTLATHIINDEPEMADEMVKANIVRYAENRKGVLTVQQGYFPDSHFGARPVGLDTVHITTAGVQSPITPDANTCHQELNNEFGYVYMSYEEEESK